MTPLMLRSAAQEKPRTPSRTQVGSALFTAMMLLIVLSLLAISAAAVTGLQERMASTYRADHQAFERAEARLRATEQRVLAEVDPCHAANPDPTNEWVEKTPDVGAENYRNLAAGPTSRAFAWRGSNKAGQAAVVGDMRCAYFEVRAIDVDDNKTPTSNAIVGSVYVP